MNNNDALRLANLAALLAERGATPSRNAYAVSHDAADLFRLGRRSASLAVVACNGTLPKCRKCGGTGNEGECRACDGDGTTYQRREQKIEKAAQTIAAPYGLIVRVGGDPRGYTLHLFAVDPVEPLPGNTWGGDESGFGVG